MSYALRSERPGVTLTDSQQQEQLQFQLSTEQLEKIIESVFCKLNKTTPGNETPRMINRLFTVAAATATKS